MKGIQGLIIAIGLGIAGAILNLAYLATRSEKLEKVDFIGVRPEVTINRGDRLKEDALEKVSIPREHAGNLDKFAFPYAALGSVKNEIVHRTLEGGTLVMRSDLKTPVQELSFGQDTPPGVEEGAMGVPIDPKKVVPSLINPGDFISFVVPRWASAAPTPAERKPGAAESSGGSESGKPEPIRSIPVAGMFGGAGPAAASTGDVELIGPFKVLSLGPRVGSAQVAQAFKLGTAQENVMMVRVRIENRKPEPEAVKLLRLMEQSDFRPLGYLLHPRSQKTENTGS